MNITQWKTGPLLALGLAAILVAGSAVAIGYILTRGDDSAQAATYMGAVVTTPIDMPNAVLTDQDGKTFDLRKETEGYVALVYVGYTHCPDICPTHLAEMAAALDALPKDVTDHVKVVFITSDPERDTPEVLKNYLKSFDPTFIGLTGTREQTDQVQADLGIPVATREDLGDGNYAVNHAAYVIAYTKDQVAHTVYLAGMGRKEWENDLPLLVKKGFAPS
ncbi:MAG: SCO family protein [Dehalococcoidia bacterium]